MLSGEFEDENEDDERVLVKEFTSVRKSRQCFQLRAAVGQSG